MLAAVLSGLVSALALPPLYVLPALLVAIPALLFLLRDLTPRRAGVIGFCFGFGQHLLGLYWITEAILIESARFWWLVPLAVPALAAVLAVFVALPCAVSVRAPAGARRVATLAGAWVLADLARQFALSGFPWNPLGSVWALPGWWGDVMIQPAALISVHGLTLATIALAASPALGRRGMQVAALGLLLWLGFGIWRLSGPALADPQVEVVLVQGNVAQGRKWDRALAIETFERHLALTRDGVTRAGARAAVVVWPETASPFQLMTDGDARAAIVEAAGVTSLIGSVRFDGDERPRNSLVAIQGPGRPPAVYDKAHLVPFGEYPPSWMPLPIQLVPGRGFAAGPGPMTLRLAGLPAVGPLICYEAIFPGEVVAEHDRPAWMVNVTNDAWFGHSSGPRQHLMAARLRAVEEGLPLMRAANTGVTAGFDAFGHEVGRLPVGEAGVLVVSLPGSLPPTLFARLGLVAPALLAGFVFCLGLCGAAFSGAGRRSVG